MSHVDAARWMRVCEVLDAVLDASPEHRQHVLATRCAGDLELQAQVQALLDADAAHGERLEVPLAERAAPLLDDAEKDYGGHITGERLGPWRLLHEIGRGGMGTVWLAERADGEFEQHVAIKLLKRGVDSEAILARFMAERRILARLQHPHIARLIDGGVSAQGRPWFAMEFVDGAPITQWCDARQLEVPERLRLFAHAIDAVQHAHRQLVVHRDLKPSNILVTADGELKLLDFGIAKLLDAQDASAEAATLTHVSGRMLTPDYAAPEQLRGEAITTATDVYALGILLYELLVGRRPTSATRNIAVTPITTTRPAPLASAYIDAIAAAARDVSPQRLQRQLRGDLDTILARALHPEPERRYGSAEALGEDLRRYLAGLPIQARRDSVWYRTRKFIARNRVPVAAVALLVLSLASGLFATAWQARKAQARAQEAELQARRAEQVKAFLIQIFEAGGPQEWRGKQVTAGELLDAGAKRVDAELRGDPALHAEMLAVIGSLYLQQNRLLEAETLLLRSLQERQRLFGTAHVHYADALDRIAVLRNTQGRWSEGAAAAQQASRIFRRELGAQPRTARALAHLSDARLNAGNLDEAIALLREALAIDRQAYGSNHPVVAEDLRALGALLLDNERHAEAAQVFTEALALSARLYGTDSVRYANVRNSQATLLYRQGRIAQAAEGYRQAAVVYRQANDIANLEDALNHYGVALCRMGCFAEADTQLRQSLALSQQTHREGSQWVGIRLLSVGSCLADAGRYSAAGPLLAQALQMIEKDVGSQHAWTAYALHEYGKALLAAGQNQQAETLLRRADLFYQGATGDPSVRALDVRRLLAVLRFSAGDRAGGLAQARQVFDAQHKVSGADNPRTLQAVLTLAELELETGQAQAALKRVRMALPILQAQSDAPSVMTARLLEARALLQLGQHTQAITQLRQAVEERQRVYGNENPLTTQAQRWLRAAQTNAK